MPMPTIVNQNDFNNRNGLLAKLALSANIITPVYKVSDKADYCSANINIANGTGIQVELIIWISFNKDTPTSEDLYEPKITLLPDAVYVRTNIPVSKNEIVYIMSNVDNAIVRIDGYEDRRG